MIKKQKFAVKLAAPLTSTAVRWALVITIGGVSMASSASATCFVNQVKRYSAGAALVAGASNLVPGPLAEAVRKGFVGGTSIGELIDFGISHWWDPHVDVFPNNPLDIVTPIATPQITAIENTLLSDMGGNFVTTSADLLGLNAVSPGMGDAASQVLITGVRAFAHVIQGAAAFAQDGGSSASVIEAANLVNGDLANFSTALTTYSGYVAAFDGTPGFPTLTQADYLGFLSSASSNGAAAVPSQEIALANDILGLANDHLVGTTFGDSIASFLGTGDTSNEASLFPAGGFTPSGLLASGAPDFRINACTCTICQIAERVNCPEPISISLLMTGVLGTEIFRRRRGRQSRPKSR